MDYNEEDWYKYVEKMQEELKKERINKDYYWDDKLVKIAKKLGFDDAVEKWGSNLHSEQDESNKGSENITESKEDNESNKDSENITGLNEDEKSKPKNNKPGKDSECEYKTKYMKKDNRKFGIIRFINYLKMKLTNKNQKPLAVESKNKKRRWKPLILGLGALSSIFVGNAISKNIKQEKVNEINIQNDKNVEKFKEEITTFVDSLVVDATKEKQKEIIDRQIIEQQGIIPIGSKINLNKEITTYYDPCDEVLVSLGKEPKSTIRENVNSDGNIGEHFVHAICLTEKNGNGQVFEFHNNEELANFLQNNSSIDINKFSISIHATKETNVEEMTQWSGVHIVTDLQGDKHYTGEGKWVRQDDTVQITKTQEKVNSR